MSFAACGQTETDRWNRGRFEFTVAAAAETPRRSNLRRRRHRRRTSENSATTTDFVGAIVVLSRCGIETHRESCALFSHQRDYHRTSGSALGQLPNQISPNHHRIIFQLLQCMASMIGSQSSGSATPSASKQPAGGSRQATLILVINNVQCDELSFEQEITIGR